MSQLQEMTRDSSSAFLAPSATAAQRARRVGFWAAITATVAGYGYLVGYIVLLMKYPLSPWSGMSAFAESLVTSYGSALTVLQILASIQALSIGLVVIVLHETVLPEVKVLTRIALMSATAFVILSSINYYVQWVAVRQGILKGNTEGLGLFTQFNFDSPMSAINMLGWTFFYGIVSLTLAPVFRVGRTERWIRWGFVVCGINGIATAIGLALGAQIMYLSWTVGISITWYVYPLIALLLRRKQRRV